MARRVIQFPVRNAFAGRRSHDSLARDAQERDSQENAHRIVEQVEAEIARTAHREARGKNIELERARSYGVVMMPRSSAAGSFRKRIAALQARLSVFAASLFSRQPQ